MKPLSFEKSLGYLLARAHRKAEDDLVRRLKPLGISVEMSRVLVALSDVGPLPMSELANLVLVEPYTLTKIIDRMVSDALVFRVPDERDRRKVRVALAEDGRALLPRVRKVAAAHEAHIGSLISYNDIRILEHLFAEDLADAT